MNLIKIYELVKDDDKLIEKLIEWNLIPHRDNYKCKKCGGNYTLTKDCSRPDGWRWLCHNKVSVRKQKAKLCRDVVEFRTGTFFARSNLTLYTILGFVHLWVSDCSLQFICQEMEISNKTAVDWASFCREVLLYAFMDNPMKIGGPGKIVEIDESKFGKRKYHRGHPVEGQWVFGGFERGTGKIFMVAVEHRNSDTLLPIIEQWIEKGTTIYSDCWKAYDCLTENGYKHLTVNHSITFKDPETGCNTNSIESSWRHAKAIITSNGRKKAHIPGNLARYMFYKHCQEFSLNRTEAFLKLAGKLYDPNKIQSPEICPSDDEGLF